MEVFAVFRYDDLVGLYSTEDKAQAAIVDLFNQPQNIHVPKYEIHFTREVVQ